MYPELRPRQTLHLDPPKSDNNIGVTRQKPGSQTGISRNEPPFGLGKVVGGLVNIGFEAIRAQRTDPIMNVMLKALFLHFNFFKFDITNNSDHGSGANANRS